MAPIKFLLVALLLLCFGTTSVLGAIVSTGYAVQYANFAPTDVTCSSTPTYLSYQPLGVCIRSDGNIKANNGNSAIYSFMLSADSSTGIISSSGWENNDCAGTPWVGISMFGPKSSCRCSTSSCSMQSYYLATLPIFTNPVQEYFSYAGSKFCNGTATYVTLTELRVPSSAASGTGCAPWACAASTSGALSTASQTTCRAPVPTTDATLPGYFTSYSFSVRNDQGFCTCS